MNKIIVVIVPFGLNLVEHGRMVEAYNLMDQTLQQSISEHSELENDIRMLKVYYLRKVHLCSKFYNFSLMCPLKMEHSFIKHIA